MNQPSFQAPSWYHALTLKERVGLRRATGGAAQDPPVNADRAGRRMQRWRSQPPFTDHAHFTRRLAADGINEGEFLYLLGEPIEAMPGRLPTPPEWWDDLARAFSGPAALPPPEVVGGQVRIGFSDAIEPLITHGRERLHNGVQALARACSELPFDPGTIDGLLVRHLSERLGLMAARTLVLELNVARLLGVLDGATPEERFHSFLRRIRRPDNALALLQEYPVLARQLTTCMDQWVTFNLEFLQHLCADWEAIRAAFSPGENPGVLVAVDGGVGDSHRGGRSVRIVRFASGVQLVYKPRSLALDVRFQGLLAWLNDRGDHPPFRTLKVLDRGDHGWVEFVAPGGCTSSEEVRRFYQRQGGYLALLYALEATDFHCENLIAAGEHPVLLDLEALFHPRVGATATTHAEDLADRTLTYSVLRVGLLPQRLWTNAGSEGIDISALGAAPGQLTPEGVPTYEGVGTDEMRLVRKRVEMPGAGNRPTLDGTEVHVPDYAAEIAAGFTAIYRLLLKHRDDLLSGAGPLAGFAGDEVRVILRHTTTYAQMRGESFHPDVLRDALDRDRLFDRLWVGGASFPDPARVISAERDDLQKGDIPIFTTRPSSRDLWTSSRERITDFLDEPALAHVRRRVQQLSNPDLEKQVWFIRASLVTLSADPHRPRRPTHPPTAPQSPAGPDRLLEAVRAVGDRLEALALRAEADATWIGLTPTRQQHWSLAPAGLDLYDGLPGVALFLAYLGSVLRDDRYTALARGALVTMRRRVEQNQGSMTALGGFTGWGGVIYALAHLGAVWRQPALFAEAEALVDRLPALIERDDQLDLMAGAAGCICGLLSLHRCAPSPATLAAAVQCGDHLIGRAQPMAQGIGWVPPVGGKTPLAGLSHGAAGIAWALLRLAALTGEERFRDAALAGIAYERSLFFPEAGNWSDLREQATSANGTPRVFPTAWCHGAPGIGLARLGSLSLLDDAAIRAEIRAALQTTLAQGFGLNHSLCHGDLGKLELLLQASRVLADSQWSAHVSRTAALVLQSISRDGWQCGNTFHLESPGLMTGLAGIGYGLLRLAEPARVPSVLLLAPPAGRCPPDAILE
jgi:type 2 lantibiotic biosynthesis protein LanM